MLPIHYTRSTFFLVLALCFSSFTLPSCATAPIDAIDASSRSAKCPIVLRQFPPHQQQRQLDAASRLPSSLEPRIVGGNQASQRLASFIAYIQNPVGSDGIEKCTGAIVAPDTIITDSFCLSMRLSDTQVYLGGTQSSPPIGLLASDISVHSRSPFAVVKFSTQDQQAWSHRMRVNVNLQYPLPGAYVRVTGYGTTDATTFSSPKSELHQLDLPVLPATDCSSIFSDFADTASFCAGTVAEKDCDTW